MAIPKEVEQGCVSKTHGKMLCTDCKEIFDNMGCIEYRESTKAELMLE